MVVHLCRKINYCILYITLISHDSMLTIIVTNCTYRFLNCTTQNSYSKHTWLQCCKWNYWHLRQDFQVQSHEASKTKKISNYLYIYIYIKNYFSAAWHIVPHVSAMSSTKMATLFLVSPTNTIDDTSLAFFLSLWIRAKSTLSLSAIDVTLPSHKN